MSIMQLRGRIEDIAAAGQRDRILIAARREKGGRMDSAKHDKVGALLDAVAVLRKLEVAYALIGGVAVGVHSGVPRATLDTDLAVVSGAERERVIEAMCDAGFRCCGEFEHSTNFRHASDEPVQFAYDSEFDVMIERAETIEVRGESVAIVQKDDLIAMKRRAAADPSRRRSKALRDRADVELLLGDVPDPDEGW